MFGIQMSGRGTRCVSPWSPASLWSRLALALALLGIILPVTGLSASAQVQNRCFASGSSDEQENEFPGEREQGDSTDSDLEAHLMCRGSPRRSLAPRCTRWKSQLLVVAGASACFHN